MAFKAFIFDLDGTLLDTIDDIAFCANTMLQEIGCEGYSIADYKIFVGKGAYKLVEECVTGRKPEAGPDELKRLTGRYIELMNIHSQDKTAPYAGIVETLGELERRGVKIAVLSNKPHEQTLAVMKIFFPSTRFDIILGQREGIPAKPDPAGVFEIIEKLGLKKSETGYVGDTSTDMQTAVSAGLFAIGVLWGFREREELEKNGANVIISSPHELLKFVE